jgi:hypothetical protein
MFPLIARSTVAPLAVVAVTVVAEEAACTLNGNKTKLKKKTMQISVANLSNLFIALDTHLFCSAITI